MKVFIVWPEQIPWILGRKLNQHIQLSHISKRNHIKSDFKSKLIRWKKTKRVPKARNQSALFPLAAFYINGNVSGLETVRNFLDNKQ